MIKSNEPEQKTEAEKEKRRAQEKKSEKKREPKREKERFFLFEKPAREGILIGLFMIYGTLTAPYNSYMAGIAMSFAVVWASDAVRKVSKYGLGTGVPSVGMFGIGLGCILSIFAVSLNTELSPIIGLVVALVIGGFCGKLINSVLGMNMPSMGKRFAEITAGCTLAMTASFIIVTGTMRFDVVFSDYFSTGIVAMGFIGTAFAIFHAYNANLGPDESQKRTKMLTVLNAFIVWLILGIAAFLTGYGSDAPFYNMVGYAVTIFMSIVFILIAYYKYWTYIKEDAWKITETGLLPSEEDLN